MTTDIIQGIIVGLTTLGIRLPLRRHDEDPCTAATAAGDAVFVVDHNCERDDIDAIEITGLLIHLINAVSADPVTPAHLVDGDGSE